MTQANRLRAQLAKGLAQAGHLRTRQWREAVEAVPRHEFLRTGFFVREDGPGPTAWRPVMPDDDRWLERAYEDESLVTQIAGTILPRDIRGAIMRAPTSSSTMPSLVVRMLEELVVEDGNRVLEIGTGTGYSTALLCHRLGDDLVTSVEVDQEVSGRASTALAACTYDPELVVGDGLSGHKGGAPYDRTIATCGVLDIPWTWIEQTRSGGTVLATVCGWLYSSELARLTVHGDATATGRLLGGQVSFMLARPQLPPPLGLLPDFAGGEERRAVLGPDALTADWAARFVAQLAAPRAQQFSMADGGRSEHVLIDVGSGAWAVLREAGGGWTVRQGGPARIWDAVEEYVVRWRSDGAPGLERFEITVTPDGQSITWPSRRGLSGG
ncbi:ATP-grasp peptide maturase system methyltransferase [Streptomyces lonegramiae]|uniref:Protein-L-isoaspartate O-methyltransferase n=1 Tax=Streptomyces lonegramiae TaxID=3075524 RepID=A0ABU2XAK8_9ACTN|nr:ATP-grasp peptide maturase system methyltransferase [Streptomyces sp. DSM 41529]MDT0542501.1 ATP-grasp peptide maturase system methyltransferase [Streptomyces sp. DSM 41529]